MSGLRGDAVCDRCLELFESEEDDEFKTVLTEIVLDHFDTRGIEVAQRLGGSSLTELTGPAAATALLNDQTFPQLDNWLRRERRNIEKRKHWQSVFSASEPPAAAEPVSNPVEPLMTRTMPVQTGKKPGRNEPCPCGSGKKYKKCCM